MHMPHVEHVESCQSDEVAKQGRDVVWSLLTATSCCPPSICIVLLFISLSTLGNSVKLTQLDIQHSGRCGRQLCFGSTWFVIVVMMFFFWLVVREDVSLNIY